MPLEFKSRKDLLRYVNQVEAPEFKNQYDSLTNLDWLKINKGQEKGWFRNYKGFKSYRQVIEESK
mgnify:CR=1 FL=1